MNQRRSTRRGFLGALAGGVVLLGAGRGNGVGAESRRPGHSSKEEFKSSCDQYEGEFIDSPKDKLTICVWPNGGKTVCDANGADCTNYDPPKPLVTGGVAAPFGGSLGEIGEIPELVSTDPAVGNAAAPEAGEAASRKRRRRRGKRRKK